MTTVMLKRASAEQVCVAWLKSLPELAGIGVAASLPALSAWGGVSFVTAGPSLGGIPNPYDPTRSPVIQVDCYAKSPNSSRPPWNVASQIAEAITDATYSASQNGILTIPGEYLSVKLFTAQPRSSPRRLYGDVEALARYSVDICLTYSPQNLVIA